MIVQFCLVVTWRNQAISLIDVAVSDFCFGLNYSIRKAAAWWLGEDQKSSGRE
jgi:hypothetical protein